MESQATFDPVSRHPLTLGGDTISAVYQGRAYYFENRDNRTAFESNPSKYLTDPSMTGRPVNDAQSGGADRPQRHGCC